MSKKVSKLVVGIVCVAVLGALATGCSSGENLIHADPLVLNNMVTNKKHIENFKSKLTNLKEQLEEVQSNYFILLTGKLCLKQGSYKVAEQFTNN